ncbi:MAG: HlyD family secretion protein [Gammaproteobacteria bacterium]|nr:HlyD family secretion protein [Gammaproteobacteria bacterium]
METPPECLALTVRAPFAGRVTAVLLRPHEYLRRGQALFMLSPDEGPVRVEAYPEQEDTTRWYEGAVVSVLLPDGSRTLGRVAELRSAAYDGTPRARGLRAGGIPAAGARAAPRRRHGGSWRGFDRMEST